ncbi:hypothetical protein KDW19_31835 [Burkholderia cenocepacia]|uniref:hypothetical protein n=1 Tax=Burkholderia cepacia complex TaxID=87882 RepID=UPI000F56C854|nr:MULTISPECIES: hypothetical protein [Burkholderia cepacia complex]ELW9451055.1 hypothetical protein [Burkholderia cenocepacia]MBR8487068.1 hypothetical protein [Burkholderia cenocepacia]MDN7468007.1 hypothetical protein [Burkholderia orbicola]MDN7504999.1 hypothetical protein [Burkholderia orbicola]
MNYPFSGIVVRYLRDQATEQSDNDVQDQLHVNLWDIADKSYLDIGLMVSDPSGINAIWIDLPWHARRSHLIDLGPGLDGDKLLTAIFNEVATYEGASDAHYAVVTLNNPSHPSHKGDSFLVVRLDSRKIEHSHLTIDGQSEVTRFCIKWPELNYSKEEHESFWRYIRLRITNVPRDVFFATFRPKDRTLLSSSVVTRLLDFRVNVRRGVPDQVLLGEARLEFPRLKKIHVFAIVPRETELPFHSEGYKGCRSLEDEEIWNGYINLPYRSHGQNGETVKNYLGYQWTAASKKPDTPVKDLVALGRFVHVTSTRSTNTRFVIVVALLGTLGSAIWDVVKGYFITRAGTHSNTDPTWRQLFLWLLLPAVVLVLLMLVDRATLNDLASRVKRAWTKTRDTVSEWWASR